MNEVSSLQDRLATAASMIIVREPVDQRVCINNLIGDELVSIWWRPGSDIPTESEAVSVALEEAIKGSLLVLNRELSSLRKFPVPHAYWRQRAKSAEGHLYASDFQAACDALHLDSNYADTPADQLTEVQKARISSAVNAVLRAVNARRDRRRPVDIFACRDEMAGKVVVDLDLFESLRDSALVEADQHRQSMAGYRPERQQLLDQIVEQCDRLLADATGRRDNQNLTRQEE